MSEPARCGALTRRGTPCRRYAGAGTDHVGFGRCKHHTGSTLNGRKNGHALAAAAEIARFGIAVEVDPIEALAVALNIQAGQVAYLERKVAELDDDEVINKGELAVLIQAWNAAVERMRIAAKTAADAGVEQRRLELDELVLDQLAAFLRAVIADLGLTPDQRARVPAAMERHREILDTLGDRPRELRAAA